MRTTILPLLLTFSTAAFSQNSYLEIKPEPLLERGNLSTFDILQEKSKLDNSLSPSLKKHVITASEPYTITNIKEIHTAIAQQKLQASPDLTITLPTFDKAQALNINIDSIETIRGRDILRGKVSGLAASQVKLVAYKEKLSGRITLGSNKRVLVIRSIDGGIAANYEVDTSTITFD